MEFRILLKEKDKNELVVSWKKEVLLTLLMLALVSFFAYWQVADHLRLRSEQKKIISFLNNDIATALAGILNSQPRFGSIVLRESIKERIDNLMQSGKGNPLNGVAFFNSKNNLLLSVKKSEIPRSWYKQHNKSKSAYLLVSKPYSEIAESAGLKGTKPVIGTRDTVISMINLLSNAPQRAQKSSQNENQIGKKVKEILSEDHFKNKTITKVSYLLDVSFLDKTISKDLILRSVSLIFCLVTFTAFTYSLFNLNRNIKLKILLAREQEKNSHSQEMHLVAAGLAHEIKNPLNLVRGTTQSIAELTASSKEIKRKTAIVAEEVDRINTRLNSFMAYSNLKKPSPKKISYKRVIDEIITLLKVDCDEKNIEIIADINDETVSADEEILRQILFNLLHNAIKAVDKDGRIVITSGRMRDKKRVWIKVSDNGSGIPKNAIEDIFKPYFSLNSSGTGLGLAIVKQLAFNHGWKIKYIRNKEKGATFRLEGIKKT